MNTQVTVMNLLMLLGITLFLMFTVIGMRAFLQERHAWKEIEVRASNSSTKTIDE